MLEETSEKPVKPAKERFVYEEVPTQMGIVIKDNETGEQITQDAAVLQILNIVCKIEKATCQT